MKTIPASFIGLLSVSALVAACGGGGSEANSPEATSSASSAPPPATSSAASTDMPPATSTAVAETPKPPAPEPAADLKVVAMKLALPKGKGAAQATVELKQDGTLWAHQGAKNTQIGTVAKNELKLTDPAGGPGMTFSVWKDNSITGPDMKKKLSFDDKDNLVVEGGGKISIDDKGKVTLTKDDGTTEKDSPTVAGFKPEGRRAAQMLMLLWMTSPTSVSESGPTAVPAATPATKTPKPATKN